MKILSPGQEQELVNALSMGDCKIIKKYLEQGLDINKPLARTPNHKPVHLLYYAVTGRKEPGIITDLLNLLFAQPDLQIDVNIDGRTPLMWAIKVGNRQAVMMLIKQGAGYKFEDENGKSILEMISDYQDRCFIKNLIKRLEGESQSMVSLQEFVGPSSALPYADRQPTQRVDFELVTREKINKEIVDQKAHDRDKKSASILGKCSLVFSSWLSQIKDNSLNYAAKQPSTDIKLKKA